MPTDAAMINRCRLDRPIVEIANWSVAGTVVASEDRGQLGDAIAARSRDAPESGAHQRVGDDATVGERIADERERRDAAERRERLPRERMDARVPDSRGSCSYSPTNHTGGIQKKSPGGIARAGRS